MQTLVFDSDMKSVPRVDWVNAVLDYCSGIIDGYAAINTSGTLAAPDHAEV